MSAASAGRPVTSEGLGYARPAMLHYGTDFLFHPWTMVFHVFTLLFLCTFIRRGAFQGLYRQKLRTFGVFTALLFLSFNALSLTGKLPSDPTTRWAIALNVISMLCLCLLLVLLLARLPRPLLPFAYIFIAIAALYRPGLMTYRWYKEDPVYFAGAHLAKNISQVAKATSDAPIWMSPGFQLEVKYLYEFGVLRSQQQADGYPNRFVVFLPGTPPDYLFRLPISQKVVWRGLFLPERKGMAFAVAPIQGSSTYQWLWRVQ